MPDSTDTQELQIQRLVSLQHSHREVDEQLLELARRIRNQVQVVDGVHQLVAMDEIAAATATMTRKDSQVQKEVKPMSR